MTTIYKLTVLANPSMNGRSSANSVNTSNIIYPQGFKKDDKVEADRKEINTSSNVLWYGIYKCIRNGVAVVLPAPIVWAASTSGNTLYLRLDETVEVEEPPAEEFPTSVWLSMSASGERREYRLVV